MSFLIKVVLLTGFVWAANAIAHCQTLANAYCGTFDSPQEQSRYIRELALKGIVDSGADAKFIEFARKLP